MNFSKMKLMTKMISLVGILSTLLIVVAVLGMQSMRQLGAELTNIANEDIPLLTVIAQTTSYQQEQSVWVERGMLAGVLGNDEGLKDAIYEFEQLSRIIQADMGTSEVMLKNGRNEAENELENERYNKLLEHFSTIKGEYVDFISSANILLSTVQEGDVKTAEELLPGIETKVEEMSELFQEFNSEISRSTIAVAKSAEEQEQYANRVLMVMSLIAILLALILGWIIVRGIKRQLGGDPSDLVGITDSLAMGQLTMERNKNAEGVYGSINQTVDKLIEIISGIKFGASEVREASEQVSQGNINLSQRTQEQASSLEEVASSMEEMTGTVNQNASNAQQAHQLASTARDQAEKGGQVVSHAIEAMDEINSSSKQIAEIIGVIDEIAFQTNLLALNAAVEAARAGEQGRGFAVVANEVRNLAGRSATAAKEIKSLIKDSVGKVEGGSRLVNESGTALAEIVASVKKVNDIVSEIAAASMEQSDGIGQVNKAILQLDEMTQQNASLVEEAAAASEMMGAQAQELSDSVAYFKMDEVMLASGAVSHADVTTQNEEFRQVEQTPRKNLSQVQLEDVSADGDWQEF